MSISSKETLNPEKELSNSLMTNECQMSLFLMYVSNNYQFKAEPPLKERIAFMNKLVELYN